MAVRRQLDLVLEPASQILHEVCGVLEVTPTNTPGGDKLRISTNGREGPHVTVTKLALFLLGDVFLFGIAESPNLIALDSLAGEITERLVLIFSASLPHGLQ